MNNKQHETLRNLPNNSRFYILMSSILLSLAVAGYLRLQIAGDQLYYIRLEQVFGFLSIIFLYIAVITSPLSKAVGEKPPIKYLLFARRAIGVSAAYFAVLHVSVALWGQIGGLDGIGLLPNRFKISFLFGVIALLVLIAMAATSFDKVISFMTLRRWKWLHRFVYASGILIILHVWMIGTHIAYSWLKVTAFIALAVFFGLEALRMSKSLAKRYKIFEQDKYRAFAALVVWLFWIGLLLALPNLVKNYHSEHHSEQDTHSHQGQGASHD